MELEDIPGELVVRTIFKSLSVWLGDKKDFKLPVLEESEKVDPVSQSKDMVIEVNGIKITIPVPVNKQD